MDFASDINCDNSRVSARSLPVRLFSGKIFNAEDAEYAEEERKADKLFLMVLRLEENKALISGYNVFGYGSDNVFASSKTPMLSTFGRG